MRVLNRDRACTSGSEITMGRGEYGVYACQEAPDCLIVLAFAIAGINDNFYCVLLCLCVVK